MKLALRTKPASDRWNDRLANWLIQARLVTRYSHAGIIIGDTLYHATALNGIVKTSGYTPGNWVLIDVGGDEQRALDVFNSVEGGRYDWFSLLAFVGVKARDSKAAYCYELCWHMLTGKHPTERVTPEDLLIMAIQMGAKA
jgi:hypothetical protein